MKVDVIFCCLFEFGENSLITVLGLMNRPAVLKFMEGLLKSWMLMNILDVLATYLAADAIRIEVMPDLAGPFYKIRYDNLQEQRTIR